MTFSGWTGAPSYEPCWLDCTVPVGSEIGQGLRSPTTPWERAAANCPSSASIRARDDHPRAAPPERCWARAGRRANRQPWADTTTLSDRLDDVWLGRADP